MSMENLNLVQENLKKEKKENPQEQVLPGLEEIKGGKEFSKVFLAILADMTSYNPEVEAGPYRFYLNGKMTNSMSNNAYSFHGKNGEQCMMSLSKTFDNRYEMKIYNHSNGTTLELSIGKNKKPRTNPPLSEGISMTTSRYNNASNKHINKTSIVLTENLPVILKKFESRWEEAKVWFKAEKVKKDNKKQEERKKLEKKVNDHGLNNIEKKLEDPSNWQHA